MARLGVFYAVSDEEILNLKKQSKENMYDYMLEEIEEKYFNTSKGYYLDKSWYGLQWILGSGEWIEENILPHNIIFGGEVLLDFENNFISLKNKKNIIEICEFLEKYNLEKIITENFSKLKQEEFNQNLDEDFRDYLIDWSKGIKDFYENARRENFNVIFTVDI